MKLFLLTLLFSQITFAMGSKKPKYEYPKDLKEISNHEREEARACIQAHSSELKFKKRLVLEKMPGEKKIYGEWCWRSPEWNGQWVCGLAYDKNDHILIKVGSHPTNGNEVQPDVIRHEHGHYWLMSNRNDYTHNPQFKKCFSQWHDLKGLKKHKEIKTDHGSYVMDYYLDSELLDDAFDE